MLRLPTFLRSLKHTLPLIFKSHDQKYKFYHTGDTSYHCAEWACPKILNSPTEGCSGTTGRGFSMQRTRPLFCVKAVVATSVISQLGPYIFIRHTGKAWSLISGNVIKRVTHTVETCQMLLMYSMYFVVVMLLFQLLTKHSLTALLCKQFVNKHL